MEHSNVENQQPPEMNTEGLLNHEESVSHEELVNHNRIKVSGNWDGAECQNSEGSNRKSTNLVYTYNGCGKTSSNSENLISIRQPRYVNDLNPPVVDDFIPSPKVESICKSHEYNEDLNSDFNIRERRNDINAFIRANSNAAGESTDIFTIPVVVHVVYNLTSQNIPDEQINSQIEILNEDFNKYNPDWQNTPSIWLDRVANVGIRFKLATIDPQGRPTDGIIRVATPVRSFTYDDLVKSSRTGGSDAWDTTKYLNIWVANLGGNLLGYAQFPGGPSETDGIVVAYDAFGNIGTAAAPYNGGRTATHEVGHWMNLYHIWGDDSGTCTGTDLIDDTPNQSAEHYGVPRFPYVSCGNRPSGDMFMNYMDYTEDGVRCMFTNGQRARMRSNFIEGGPRYSMVATSDPGSTQSEPPICITQSTPPTSPPSELEAPSGLTYLKPSFTRINWFDVGARTYEFQYRRQGTINWMTLLTDFPTIDLYYLQPSVIYEYRVRSIRGSEYSAYTEIATLFNAYSGFYEPNNSIEAAVTINIAKPVFALINDRDDNDYFKFKNISEGSKIEINLTNLVADYDMQLLDEEGDVILNSERPNTSDELITLNNAPIGIYYIRIYGWNGASSATEFYQLTVSIEPKALFRKGSLGLS